MVKRLPLPDMAEWIEDMYCIKLQPWQKELLTRLQKEADRKIAERKIR